MSISVTMSRSKFSTDKSYQQRKYTLPSLVQFKRVISLSGIIPPSVERKPHGSQMIKKTYNVVKPPLIYE